MYLIYFLVPELKEVVLSLYNDRDLYKLRPFLNDKQIRNGQEISIHFDSEIFFFKIILSFQFI